MQILIPLTVFLVIGFIFAGVAARQEKESRRIGFALTGMIILSGIVGSVTYPLGGYYPRILSHQGTERMKAFMEDLNADIEADQPSTAKKKIEFILAEWENIEFLENEPEWGVYIGDLVEQAKLIEQETEPDVIVNGEAAPRRD